MEIQLFDTKGEMARAAAECAADILRRALAEKATARFIAATGASQFEFLENLTGAEGIDWARTEMFHLDEYIGFSDRHPASFVKYLRERLVEKVRPGAVYFLNGEAPDAHAEARRVGELIARAPVDAAFVGIGENGHLAFNDPPADFETTAPYLVVELDEACRRQQLGEGWFASLDEVPRQALSMSVRQIVSAREIVCTVPDARKARAVAECLGTGAAVSNRHPASILKEHPNAHVFLDRAAAAELS